MPKTNGILFEINVMVVTLHFLHARKFVVASSPCQGVAMFDYDEIVATLQREATEFFFHNTVQSHMV